MSQSLSKILVHLVFSAKGRLNLIPTNLIGDLHAYLAGACRAQGSEAFRVGGTENHVHIACTLPRTMAVSDLLKSIKRSSSVWIKEQSPTSAGFAWQAGYGAFSFGQSQLGDVIRYIEDQKEHHKRICFKEELMQLLRKYEAEYDERYLWD